MFLFFFCLFFRLLIVTHGTFESKFYTKPDIAIQHGDHIMTYHERGKGVLKWIYIPLQIPLPAFIFSIVTTRIVEAWGPNSKFPNEFFAPENVDMQSLEISTFSPMGHECSTRG